MGNGYPSGPLGDEHELSNLLRDLQRRVKELESLDGSQNYDTVQTLKNLVDGLIDQTDVNVTGNVTAGGTGTFTAGVTSAGVFSLDVSLLPGTRRTNWTNANGQIGYAPSSILRKHIRENYRGRAADFLACQPVIYEYLGQLAIRDDSENPYYDPDYVVPLEVGHIAQWLVENNLPEFVFYEEDGVTPAGINYAEFAAVGFVVVGRDHEERIARLEQLLP